MLTQLEGVGMFTALVLLAEIGDIKSLASESKLEYWEGLTKTVSGRDSTVH